MELNNIERLLEAYFEGTTSLEEEAVLRDYFNNDRVPVHLLQYKPIFVGLQAAQKERSKREFYLPTEKSNSRDKTWWYWIAAMLVVTIGVGIFYTSQPRMTQEEREALAAFENSKNTMLLLSENLNKGVEQLSYVEQFTIAKDKVFKKE